MQPAFGSDHEPPFFGYKGPKPNQSVELPMVYLPRGLDNSSGGQTYVDSDRFGPIQGQMIHASFGAAAAFVLLRDEVQGQVQGAFYPIAGEFKSGVHRGNFNPVDGQLYLSGMAGWGTYSIERGCLQRVRYTGNEQPMPIGFHVHENGIAVRFSKPLNAAVCQQARNHFAQAWNYRYSAAYGSSEYSTRHYGIRGHDRLDVRSSHVLDEGKTLFLEIPELQPVNNLHLQMTIDADKTQDLYLTCHRLDAPRSDFAGYVQVAKTIQPHPIELDLAMAARQIPNPWKGKIEGARAIRMEAGKNLSFATRQFTVKAGEVIALSMVNPDVVPHNWALVKPGALQRVGEEANKLVADPEAVIRQYVPQTDDVICYTDIVDPEATMTIYFRAPETPGRYPYLCTFPGHWMVMNGEMIVEAK
jgi:azurin